MKMDWQIFVEELVTTSAFDEVCSEPPEVYLKSMTISTKHNLANHQLNFGAQIMLQSNINQTITLSANPIDEKDKLKFVLVNNEKIYLGTVTSNRVGTVQLCQEGRTLSKPKKEFTETVSKSLKTIIDFGCTNGTKNLQEDTEMIVEVELLYDMTLCKGDAEDLAGYMKIERLKAKKSSTFTEN